TITEYFNVFMCLGVYVHPLHALIPLLYPIPIYLYTYTPIPLYPYTPIPFFPDTPISPLCPPLPHRSGHCRNDAVIAVEANLARDQVIFSGKRLHREEFRDKAGQE